MFHAMKLMRSFANPQPTLKELRLTDRIRTQTAPPWLQAGGLGFFRNAVGFGAASHNQPITGRQLLSTAIKGF
jgi:hypothetical protein